MSIEQPTVGNPEDCPTAELDALIRENILFEEACYHGACAALRADAFQRLQKYDAQREGRGWAVFAIRPDGEESAENLVGEYKEVLLLTDPVSDAQAIDGRPISNLRIITNEMITAPDGVAECISCDFTLDHEDDAQYAIDATNFREEEDTDAILFMVRDEDGKLGFNKRVREFTGVRIDRYRWDDEPGELSLFKLMGDYRSFEHGEPFFFKLFGDYRNRSDKSDALAFGRGIMAEIATLEPVYVRPS